MYKKRINRYSYLSLVLSLILILALCFDKFDKGSNYGIIFLVSISIFSWAIRFLYPKYIISNNQLIIKDFLEKKEIDIQTIHKIEDKKFAFTKYSWKSLEKGLLIHYNKYDDVLISPKEKQKFINELLYINPNITL